MQSSPPNDSLDKAQNNKDNKADTQDGVANAAKKQHVQAGAIGLKVIVIAKTFSHSERSGLVNLSPHIFPHWLPQQAASVQSCADRWTCIL